MNVFFASLGCDKNLVDSEHMLGRLTEAGFRITGEETEADIIVINTCCFIHDAKQESVDTILEMAAYRREGRCRALIVTGCLSERYREEILAEIPEVDIALGTNSIEKIEEAIRLCLAGTRQVIADPLLGTPGEDDRRVVTTGGHYAYLKIAEGCDKRCTYCIIPALRGPFRSVPMEKLVREARELADMGVRELILVAQETTLYGADLPGAPKLPQLLRALCRIPQISWIRLLYCYPEDVTPELLACMAEEEKICNYLDIPVQHANSDILRRMGRAIDGEGLRATIRKIREAVPGIALRTTLITGFPGETQEQHEELLAFVKEQAFPRLGVFTYSQEEGTPAAGFAGQIPEEVKRQRREELLFAQQEVSAAYGASLLGRELEVFVEGFLPEEGVYVGRSRFDAPDVDGLVFIDRDRELTSGEIVRVRVNGSTAYDITGECV